MVKIELTYNLSEIVRKMGNCIKKNQSRKKYMKQELIKKEMTEIINEFVSDIKNYADSIKEQLENPKLMDTVYMYRIDVPYDFESCIEDIIKIALVQVGNYNNFIYKYKKDKDFYVIISSSSKKI